MATVIKRFKCKLTKKRYAPGMLYEGTPERIAFLQKAGYLEDAPLPVIMPAPKNLGGGWYEYEGRKYRKKDLPISE